MQLLDMFSFSLFALISVGLFFASQHKQQEEQASMLYTTGTITRKWDVTWKSTPVYKIAYTFDEGIETQQIVTEDFFNQTNVGDTIRVRYLSYDPSVSIAVCSL